VFCQLSHKRVLGLAAVTHPEKAAKLKLLLFKPFTKPEELRPNNVTWQQALRAFERTASRRVKRLLQHIDQICRHEQAGIEHRRKRLEELRRGIAPTGADDHDVFSQFGLHRGDEPDVNDDTTEIDAPEFGQDESAGQAYTDKFRRRLRLNLAHGTHGDAGMHIQQTLDAAAERFVFRGLQTGAHGQATANAPLAAGVYKGLSMQSLETIQRQVGAQLKASKAAAAGAKLLNPSQPMQVLQLLPLGVQSCLPEAWKLKLPINPAPEVIADGFRLNRKQRLAFYIVADRFAVELARDNATRGQQEDLILRNFIPGFVAPQTDSTDAIRLFLAGPAGTGKSHVIAAIQFLFTLYGKRDWLLLTATTGTASVSISGATVHSALGLSLYGSTEDDDAHSSSNQPNDTVNRKVKFIVLDEVSLVLVPSFRLRCHVRGCRCPWPLVP
jgi:hypothetical protein